jgi:hypothetical protein
VAPVTIRARAAAIVKRVLSASLGMSDVSVRDELVKAYPKAWRSSEHIRRIWVDEIETQRAAEPSRGRHRRLAGKKPPREPDQGDMFG